MEDVRAKILGCDVTGSFAGDVHGGNWRADVLTPDSYHDDPDDGYLLMCLMYFMSTFALYSVRTSMQSASCDVLPAIQCWWVRMECSVWQCRIWMLSWNTILGWCMNSGIGARVCCWGNWLYLACRLEFWGHQLGSGMKPVSCQVECLTPNFAAALRQVYSQEDVLCELCDAKDSWAPIKALGSCFVSTLRLSSVLWFRFHKKCTRLWPGWGTRSITSGLSRPLFALLTKWQATKLSLLQVHPGYLHFHRQER